MSYYLKTHMPLVAQHWTSYGLKKWDVIQYSPGPDGSKPKYSVCAILTWSTPEEVGKAMAGEEAKIILGDVTNFSNKQPDFLAGEVVGTS
jgi:uncharacterized protein (TIGR02118 family)